MPCEDEIASSTMTASGGVTLETSCIKVRGEIGTREASASARFVSSARSAANAAVTASRRLAAWG